MSYIDQEIFQDNRINSICDLIYQELYAAFPPTESQDPNYIYLAFLLSGRAGAILQGATEQPILNVIFETNNTILYDWCKTVLPSKLAQCKYINFKERMLLYPQDLFFEIWFSETLDAQNYSGNIYSQKTSLIPEETL